MYWEYHVHFWTAQNKIDLDILNYAQWWPPRLLEAGACGRGEAERGLPSLERDGCQGSCCCLQLLGDREEGGGSQIILRGAQQKAMNTVWNLENCI